MSHGKHTKLEIHMAILLAGMCNERSLLCPCRDERKEMACPDRYGVDCTEKKIIPSDWLNMLEQDLHKEAQSE